MPLCPKCHARYAAGASSCPTCRVPLLGVVERSGLEAEPEPEFESLKLLAEVALPEMAGMIEEFLKSSGIGCVVQTESIGLLYRLPLPLASSRIFVRESDFDEARELMSHFFTSD
jgi:hypothetical protein